MKFHHKLFLVLVGLLPVQLGYHFWPQWSYVFGRRIDYLSPTIFLTDILIGLLLVFWFITKPKITFQKHLKLFMFGLVFVFANIYFSFTWQVTLYKWIKLLELLLLAIYVKENWKMVQRQVFIPLIVALVFTFVLSLGQLYFQRTLGGVFYFFGERSFTASTPSIALANVFGRSILRPYATFSHPNVLGAFGLFSFVLLFFYSANKVRTISLVLSGALVLISFSQGVWLAFICIIGLLVFGKNNQVIERGVKLFVMVSVVVSMVMFLVLPILKHTSNFSDSVYKRIGLIEVTLKEFQISPVFGVGLGGFIPASAQLFFEKRVDLNTGAVWFLQPVHNIHLLVLAEFGLIGFLVYFYLIKKILDNRLNLMQQMLIVIIGITGFVDHYWLTIQQTQIIFAIVVGIIFSYTTKTHGKINN